MKVQDAWIGSFIQNRGKEKASQILKLEELAAELGISTAVLALAWCLKNPNVSSVILGASKTSQLIENIQAVEAQAKLTPDVLKRINEIVA
jgi:aryl-alcohol dehydrogenase-like predicted oxidoreductase